MGVTGAVAGQKRVEKSSPLVRLSYKQPLETLDTNVTGTSNVLAAVTDAGYTADEPCTLVVITSDKCYENRETYEAYREDEHMGGHDIYSASKGMMELLVSSWRRSFSPPESTTLPAVRIVTCRAGNIIGGGDWSADRIVVDCVKALTRNEPIPVRNPLACRPWQHVLEPLSGYLHVGARMASDVAALRELSTGFNFGPGHESERSVGELCNTIVNCWGSGSWQHTFEQDPVHEARYLKLAIDKAWHHLAWQPTWDFRRTIENTIEWYKRGHETGHDPDTMRALTRDQIAQFTTAAGDRSAAWAM